jgi:hypothetical protein
MLTPFCDPEVDLKRVLAKDIKQQAENEYINSMIESPAPRVAGGRRLSLVMQHRLAAETRAHPSMNFKQKAQPARDAAHAQALLVVYCDRLVDWGIATFESDSPETRLLETLKELCTFLQSSTHASSGDCSIDETQAHAIALISLAREVLHAKDFVSGFRLTFEVEDHIYDIVEVTQCLHRSAVSTLLTLFLST